MVNNESNNGGGPRGFLHPKTVETVIACLIALIGFLGLAVWKDIDELTKNNQQFREKIYSEYVQKQDYKEDINRLYNALTEINRKLDRLNSLDRNK